MKATGPLFKWFGAKWQASKYYPRPKYPSILEPFAGSACYALRNSSARTDVTLAESNLNVYNLWDWLIHEASEHDIREIPINLKEGTNILDVGLTRGQSLLLKHWQRTNNVGNCWTISPWGNKPGQFTANTRARVANEVYLVKRWKVYRDGFSAMRASLGAVENPLSTWFVDPCYQYNYQYGCGETDYGLVAEMVKMHEGQAIVCEAKCPKTGKIPNWLPFRFFRRTVTSRRKSTNNHHSSELIWTNDNSPSDIADSTQADGV